MRKQGASWFSCFGSELENSKKLSKDEIVELLPQQHNKNRIKFPSTEDTFHGCRKA